MKRFTLFAFLLILVASMGIAQDAPRAHGSAGSTSIITTLDALANIKIGGFESGFGLRTYLLPGVSVRGSVGGTITTGGEAVDREISTTGSVLFDLTSGNHSLNAYFGPHVKYSHAGAQTDEYEFGGLVGVEVFNVVVNGISLGTEFPVSVTSSPSSGTHVWKFGAPSGVLILGWQL